MPQVNKPMLDAELKYLSDRAKEMLENDKEAVEEIATAMANQMFQSLFETAQYHLSKNLTDAIREQTSVLKELLVQKPVVPVSPEDTDWKAILAKAQLTNMESMLLLAPIPEDVDIKDYWHLWSLAKESRTNMDEPEEVIEPVEEVSTKGIGKGGFSNRFQGRIKWKGMNEQEQKEVVFEYIEKYFDEYGKLPNSTDMQGYYQSINHKGHALFGSWKDAILSYVNR